MMHYRKKPVVIEAVQFGDDPTPIIDWILTNGGTARYHDEGSTHIAIDTLEGTMAASPGDWIIRGLAGEFYPCRDDIFTASYDQVP